MSLSHVANIEPVRNQTMLFGALRLTIDVEIDVEALSRVRNQTMLFGALRPSGPYPRVNDIRASQKSDNALRGIKTKLDFFQLFLLHRHVRNQTMLFGALRHIVLLGEGFYSLPSEIRQCSSGH